MALVGDNGAGKSTLIKCDRGDPPARRAARSSSTASRSTSTARRTRPRLGIEIVYQDLALCDNLDVVQNMYLGPRGAVGASARLDEATMEQKARETLEGPVGHDDPSIRQIVAGLSGGQRQSVAVAKAVMWNSKLVILDEPTAALGVAQTRQVLDLVKRLGEQGLAVILISHNLHDVFEVADSITVLRLGQNVAEFKRRRRPSARSSRRSPPASCTRSPACNEEVIPVSAVADDRPPESTAPRSSSSRSAMPCARGGSACATASSARCRSSSGIDRHRDLSSSRGTRTS